MPSGFLRVGDLLLMPGSSGGPKSLPVPGTNGGSFASLSTGRAQVNLDQIEYWEPPWLLNVAHTFSGRSGVGLSGSAYANTIKDANGYTSDLNGESDVRYICLWRQDSRQTWMDARWRFEWDGGGTFTAYGGNVTNVDTATPNRVEFDFAPTGDGIESGAVISMTSLGSPHPTNFRMCRVADWALLEAGEILNPIYKANFGKAARLRMMEAAHTNDNAQTTWASRPTPSTLIWTGVGIPIEAQVDICNQTGVDGWFCIPHAADDNFVTQMATLIRDRLNPNLNFVLELSNETWNTVFSQQAYFAGLGTSEWGGASELEYYGFRSYQVFGIFETVFGGTSRFTRLINVQTVGRPTTINPGDYLYQILNSPNNPGPEVAKDRIDAIGLTCYFNGSNSIAGHQAILDTYQGSGYAAAESQLVSDIIDNIHGTFVPQWEGYLASAQTEGLQLHVYEGGTHVLRVFYESTTDDAALHTFYRAFHRSEAYADLTLRSITAWNDVVREGVDGPWTGWRAVYQHSLDYGFWGQMEHIGAGADAVPYKAWAAYNDSGPAATAEAIPLSASHVASGHSLTNAVFVAGTFPWLMSNLVTDAGGNPNVDRSTIPGSSMTLRRTNFTGDDVDAWATIANYEILSITEVNDHFPEQLFRGTGGVDDVDGAANRQVQRDELLLWVDRAWTVGNSGNGAQTFYYSSWVAHGDFAKGSPQFNAPTTWRERLERDEAEHQAKVTWVNMNSVSGCPPVRYIPGNKLMMALWDAAEAGNMPGITDAAAWMANTTNWWDEPGSPATRVHPIGYGQLALGYLHMACIHHVDPRTLSYTGFGLAQEPDATTAAFIAQTAYDVARTTPHTYYAG